MSHSQSRHPSYSPSVPKNEEARLNALRQYKVLDTPSEPSYDDIVRMAADVLGVTGSALKFVDRDRQWVKSGVGISRSEIPREASFGAHVILRDTPTVINNAVTHRLFKIHPFVISGEIGCYAGVPVRSREGFRIGVLCVFGPSPKEFTEKDIEWLKILGKQIEAQLELRLKTAELAVREELLQQQGVELNHLAGAEAISLMTKGHRASEQSVVSEPDARQPIDARDLQTELHLHSLWLSGNGGKRADLSNRDLRGHILRNIELQRADCNNTDFSSSVLIGSSFEGAFCQGAIFDDADLTATKFTGSDLGQATFRGANMTQSDFEATRMYQVDLTRAIARRVSFRFADLTEAVMVEMDLTEAALDLSDMTSVDLTSATLTNSTMKQTQLRNSKLNKAILLGTNLQYAVISGATLEGAVFVEADMKAMVQAKSLARRRNLKRD